jgi:hypothetical protein
MELSISVLGKPPSLPFSFGSAAMAERRFTQCVPLGSDENSGFEYWFDIGKEGVRLVLSAQPSDQHEDHHFRHRHQRRRLLSACRHRSKCEARIQTRDSTEDRRVVEIDKGSVNADCGNSRPMCCVGKRRIAATPIPSQHAVRTETQAAKPLHARRQGESRRRRYEDLGSADVIEDVCPIKRTCKGAAIVAITHEAHSGIRCEVDTAVRFTATTAKRDNHQFFSVMNGAASFSSTAFQPASTFRATGGGAWASCSSFSCMRVRTVPPSAALRRLMVKTEAYVGRFCLSGPTKPHRKTMR